tara:strand:- start:1908 stop:2546 length:639 start_codon:yes stop_codon:yes gene_type:complete
MENKSNYKRIVAHYEDCLGEYGDTHLGVDWPNEEDAKMRYKVMLDILKFVNPKDGKIKLLDFGCGTGHLLEFINQHDLNERIEYIGLDLSQKFVDMSEKKFPNHKFICSDVLENEINESFDIIIMNGIFTEKLSLTENEMWDYFKRLLQWAFNNTKMAVSFNVMSKIVDWEREDLFHMSMDKLGKYLSDSLTRNYIIRNDYGLYEFTTYLIK